MKSISLFIMAALYITAGALHFWHPQIYLPIIPPWLPMPLAFIWLSGAFEISFGVLLLLPATRRVAAWLIIALLVAVFPANIQMALNWQQANHPLLWLAWMRLPLQLLLIWWAYSHTRT